MSILLASVLPVLITCTNCCGVGYFQVPCERCAGSGLVDPPKSTRPFTPGAINRMLNGKLPCPKCSRGLYTAKDKIKKGSGVQRVTCKTCFGKKKIRR